MLYLRKPVKDDLGDIRLRYERSKSFHLPWTHPPKDYDSYLADSGRRLLCLEESDEIVGTFNVSGIVRGYFQSAYLAYAAFAPYQSKGFMRVGLDLFIKEMYESLNLHRLEANIQPGNEASIKLVSGAGFVKEGFSRNYLNIDNQGWKDHERWALLNESWCQKHSQADS